MFSRIHKLEPVAVSISKCKAFIRAVSTSKFQSPCCKLLYGLIKIFRIENQCFICRLVVFSNMFIFTRPEQNNAVMHLEPYNLFMLNFNKIEAQYINVK